MESVLRFINTLKDPGNFNKKFRKLSRRRRGSASAESLQRLTAD